LIAAESPYIAISVNRTTIHCYQCKQNHNTLLSV